MKRRACFPPKVVLFLSLCLSFVFPAFAQTGISGKVVDEKNNPVTGATVTIKNGKASTRTNEQGVFRFNNVTGSNVLLVITHVSFDRKEVTYTPGVEMTITLSESS